MICTVNKEISFVSNLQRGDLMEQIQLYKYVSKEYDERYYFNGSEENTDIEKTLTDFIYKYEIRSVLELGCGTGYWLNILYKLGLRNLLGIDGSKYMLSVGKQKYGKYLKFLKANILKSDFKLGKYDLIMCNYFLSLINFDEIDNLLMKIFSIDSEYFFIIENTTFDECINSQTITLTEKWGNKIIDISYFVYRAGELIKKIENVGYKLIEFTSINEDVVVYIFKKRFKNNKGE